MHAARAVATKASTWLGLLGSPPPHSRSFSNVFVAQPYWVNQWCPEVFPSAIRCTGSSTEALAVTVTFRSPELFVRVQCGRKSPLESHNTDFRAGVKSVRPAGSLCVVVDSPLSTVDAKHQTPNDIRARGIYSIVPIPKSRIILRHGGGSPRKVKIQELLCFLPLQSCLRLKGNRIAFREPSHRYSRRNSNVINKWRRGVCSARMENGRAEYSNKHRRPFKSMNVITRIGHAAEEEEEEEIIPAT